MLFRSAPDLDSFSRFALNSLINLPNVKDLQTSFSLGEVKAAGLLPLGHLQPARVSDVGLASGSALK